jgi:glycosyltransferase involved in cell wall biosynthesis
VVDNDFFRSEAERLKPMRNELRKQWGLEDDTIVFVFSGKFIEKKRPLDFVRAVLLAAQRSSRIQGLMVGDGPLRMACQELAKNHNAPVRFAGFLNQSRIPSAYAACDALVLPSDGGETWGLVVNEAMACGLPAIVSDRVGCGPDLIVKEKTGFIFPMSDVEVLASQIVQMADDPTGLNEMGVQASRMIENYSPPVAVDDVVQCLRTILT